MFAGSDERVVRRIDLEKQTFCFVFLCSIFRRERA